VIAISTETAALRAEIHRKVMVLWRFRRKGDASRVEKMMRKIRELKKTLAEFERAEWRI